MCLLHIGPAQLAQHYAFLIVFHQFGDRGNHFIRRIHNSAKWFAVRSCTTIYRRHSRDTTCPGLQESIWKSFTLRCIYKYGSFIEISSDFGVRHITFKLYVFELLSASLNRHKECSFRCVRTSHHLKPESW